MWKIQQVSQLLQKVNIERQKKSCGNCSISKEIKETHSSKAMCELQLNLDFKKIYKSIFWGKFGRS